MALVVCDGPRRHDHRRRVGRDAVARRMADGAGLGDPRKPHGLLREPHRQLPPLLPRDAERPIPARPRQQVPEHPRQHVEDRIGDPQILLRPERAVLEPLLLRIGAELGPPLRLDVAADLLLHDTEGLVPDIDAPHGADDDQHRGDAEDLVPGSGVGLGHGAAPLRMSSDARSAPASPRAEARFPRGARRCRCRGRPPRRRCRSSAAPPPGRAPRRRRG